MDETERVKRKFPYKENRYTSQPIKTLPHRLLLIPFQVTFTTAIEAFEKGVKYIQS